MNELKFDKNDGGRFKVTGNPKDWKKVGDCSIRACAIGTGLPYDQVYKELFEISCAKYENGISNSTMEEFLLKKGFEKVATPKKCLGEIPIKGVYIAHIRSGYGTHATTVIDGVINDTWKPSEVKRMAYYYKKGGVK